jgi:hypothetical protein
MIKAAAAKAGAINPYPVLMFIPLCLWFIVLVLILILEIVVVGGTRGAGTAEERPAAVHRASAAAERPV